jgi:predicted MFS family arabinose efflux permease
LNARIYLLALGTFALGTDLFVIAGVLPAIAHDRSVDIHVAGLLVTVFTLTYGFGAPILATFTEKISRRTLLLVVLSCFSLANVGSAISPTFPILMATRVLAACFAALYTPTATATAVTLVAPKRRGQALGIVFGGLTLSTILGVPLGTWLGQHLGWPATFLFVAGLSGLAVVALLAFRLKNIPNPPILGLKARIAPLLQPGTLFALLPLAFWAAGGFATYTYIAPFLARYTHLSDPTLMLFIFGAGGVLGSWLGGYLVDRFGSTRLIMFGLFVLVAIYATLPLTATTLFGAACVLALWGICGTMLFAPQQHRMLALVLASPTVILALNSSALYLGLAGGSVIGSLVLARGSISALTPTSAMLVMLSLAMFAFSVRFSAQQRGKRVSSSTQTPSPTAAGDTTE